MSSDFAAQTERERALFEMVRLVRQAAVRFSALYVEGARFDDDPRYRDPSYVMKHEGESKRTLDSFLMNAVPGELTHGVLNYCEWQDLLEKSNAEAAKKSSGAAYEPAGPFQSMAGEASANRTQEGSAEI